MLRKVFCFIIVLILLSVSFSSFAESNLKRFEKLLTGKWEWVAIDDVSYFDTYRGKFDSIREFSFSKDESIILRYGSRDADSTVKRQNRTTGVVSDYKANIYLTEDGSGCIYITIIIPERLEMNVGKSSFSDDGKTLLILPTTGGTALYQKKY